MSVYQKIFKYAPIGIAFVGADFKLLKVNPMLCQILGYDEAELLGKTFVDITHREDIDKDVNLITQLFRGEISSYRIEKRYITKDQRIIWGNLTATLFHNQDGTIQALKLVEDITERKHTEEALKISEQRFRLFMEMAADGIMIFDQAGNILMANTKARELLGYNEEEVLQLNLQAIVAPEDLQRQPIRYAQMQRGETIQDERLLIRKDGSQLTVDVSAKFLPDMGFQVIFRDVSQRKAHEADMKELIENLEKALANVRTLEDLLPICSVCKKIRNDDGYWQQIESYITEQTGTHFSHAICRDCAKELYPDYYDRMFAHEKMTVSG
ncbi:MAG: PAS domain S-box protein [Acidobacteriota bacterium]